MSLTFGKEGCGWQIDKTTPQRLSQTSRLVVEVSYGPGKSYDFVDVSAAKLGSRAIGSKNHYHIGACPGALNGTRGEVATALLHPRHVKLQSPRRRVSCRADCRGRCHATWGSVGPGVSGLFASERAGKCQGRQAKPEEVRCHPYTQLGWFGGNQGIYTGMWPLGEQDVRESPAIPYSWRMCRELVCYHSEEGLCMSL